MSEWIFMNLIDRTGSQFCCFYFHLGAFSCLLIKSVLNTLQAHWKLPSMQIIKERGAQNEIWLSPENKQALLEVGRKGKEMVLQHVGTVLKTKQKPPWRWKHRLIQNNSSLQTITCIHHNH